MLSWKMLFEQNLLDKARALQEAGKTRLLSQEDYGYSVHVEDDGDFLAKIFLNYEDRIHRLECSCRESQSGKYCVHMAAALFFTEKCLQEKYYLDTALERNLLEKAAASVPAKKKKAPALKTRGQQLMKTYRQGINTLSAMQDSERRERENASAEEGAKVIDKDTSAYQYFRLDSFRKNLGFVPNALAKAQKLLDGKNYHPDIQAGYFRPPQDIYVSPNNRESRSREAAYLVRVIVRNTRNEWVSEIYFDRDGPVSAQCRNWECLSARNPLSRIGHTLCEHEALALLMGERFLQSHPLGDETNHQAMVLLDTLGGNLPAGPEPAKAQSVLHLEPLIRENHFSRATVQFRVGAGRLYKVMDLQQFSRDVAKGSSVTFGRSTVLQLSESAFDEEGEVWLDFLRHSLQILSSFSGADYRDGDVINFWDPTEGWVRIKDHLPLYGQILDRFFDAATGKSIAWEKNNFNKEKLTVSMKDAALRPKLLLTPELSQDSGALEKIQITGRLPYLLHGSDASYHLEDDCFCRIPRAVVNGLAPLFEIQDNQGKIRLDIGRRHLADFWKNALPRLQEIAEVQIRDPELIEKYLPSEPAFIVYLDVEDGVVLCRPEVCYDELVCSPFDVYAWKKGARVPEIYRDTAEEERLIRFLEKYLPDHDEEAGIFLSETGEEALYEFLDHGLTELLELAEVRASERFRALRVRRRLPLQVGVSLESGIMNLSLTSEELSPEELLEILGGYRRKAKYVRLKNGDFIRLEDNKAIEQMNELLDTLHLAPRELIREKMELPAFRALYLDRMLESMQDVYSDRDRRFKSLIKEFKTVSDADFAVPASLKGTLRKYQVAGYRWLRTLDSYGFGGILADDMGLGKTLQTIAVLLAVKQETGETASIIVCPASLIYNWQDELSRFAPELTAIPIVGSAPERRALIADASSFDVLITSYDYLKRDVAEYQGHSFRFAVVDEAQYIKNQTTAAAKSVKLLSAKSHIALTGTPIENKLSDLWSIFDFLMPGFLYSYHDFRTEFELPIVKTGDEKASDRLHRMAAPFILRRSKKDVLPDLPDKLEEIRYAGFEKGGEQRLLYNASVVRMQQKLREQTDEDFGKNRIQILAELTRIRQICCDPQLLVENYHGDSAKRDACMDLIRSAVEGEHKILLFSQFTSMLELLEEDLQKEGLAWYKITGSTPKEERARLVKAFNQDATPLFLISLKAGGTGLNLTGADVVIHYDPWWNVAAQNQATDRAHRIGQTKVVTVYRLILKDTIEDRILELQERKKALADELLSTEAVSSSRLSRDELLSLLS